MKLSKAVLSMEHSPIRKFTPIARKAEAEGKKVYFLNIGQPDIETPQCFMDAVRNFDEKVIEYADSSGRVSLLEAVSDYFKSYGMNFEKEHLLMTNGGSEALNMVFSAILDPDDKVLVPEPYYTNYDAFIGINKGNIQPITTTPEEGYHFADVDRIEAAITPEVKAICVSTPGNPTGTVMTLDEMKLICQIAEKYDLWIIADEVYREFVYDDGSVASFGMLPEYEERIIIVDSVSKRYSACGARVGLIATKNEMLMDNLMKIARGRLCIPTLEQVGAAELFKLPKSYYEDVRKEYEARRDAVYEQISKIPNVVCRKPAGSFYLMAKLPVDNVEKFLLFMLEEFDDNGETVMFTPAEGFYVTEGLGREEIRIAYVLNTKDIARSAELIRLGIEAYNSR